MPATATELREGLAARRQNAWPSVKIDLMAVNSLAAPLWGAGFYYKTFMGPTRGAWMFYERFIRRAAGLGRAVHLRDPDRYETRHAFAEVLIVGAGPAGLAAALAAGSAGARVVLVEQDWLLGGSLLSASVSPDPSRPGAPGAWESWRHCTMSRSGFAPPCSASMTAIRWRWWSGGAISGPIRPRAKRAKSSSRSAPAPSCWRRAADGTQPTLILRRTTTGPASMLASAVRRYLNLHAVAADRPRWCSRPTTTAAMRTAVDLARRRAFP